MTATSQAPPVTGVEFPATRKSTAALPRSIHARWLRWVLLMMIVAGQLTKAEPGMGASQRIIHESWSFKDGAPEGVEALAQTADGYLWLGGASGLFRFDGMRFEAFRSPFGDELPSTNVSALFAPANGGLWIGFRFAGFSFLKDGKLTNFSDSPGPTSTVNGFARDRKGIVWAATNSGLWRFNGSSWEQNPYAWPPQLTRVAQVGLDREGTLWVLTENRGLEYGRQLLFLSPGEIKFRKAADNLFVQGFTWDANSMILTTREQTRRSREPGLELEQGLPAYPILKKNSEQILDLANGIWFLPVDPFVLRHPAGEPLGDIISRASRADSQVYDVNPYRFSRLVDREGSIWIGDAKGVHRFSYSPLSRLTFPASEVNPYFALAPDAGGVVWINAGNQNGASNFYRVADGRAELQKRHQGIAGFAYRALDGSFWFGGEGGLWHMVNGRLTRVEVPPAVADKVAFLQAITQDRRGGIWVSFGGLGLYRLFDGVWTANGGRKDLRKASVTSAFTDDLGRVWFGSRTRILTMLDGDRARVFDKNDGLQVGAITAIYGRGPEIWIGGELGLQRFEDGHFRAIQAVDRESLRGVSGIVQGQSGDLWLNGLGGIFHISRAEINEALKNSAYLVGGERFGRRDGVPGLPAQLRPIPTAVMGTDGRLWFTVNNGVVWLDPARASKHVLPPPVTIESVTADDKVYPLQRGMRFPAHSSSVQIRYAVVSLSNPEAIRSQYQLQETDKDWHEAGASNVVSYRNLPPGSYHFIVRASDTSGMWSDKTATAEFTLLPAFYQTNAFRAAAAAAMLLLLWGLYRVRMHQISREFKAQLAGRVDERLRVARELHDTLLQSFQAPLIFFQAARNMCRTRPEEAEQVLDKAINLAQEAVTEGREAIQSMRSSTEVTNELADAFRQAGEEFASDSVAFRVVVEGSPKNLHPIVRDEVYRIGNEAIRNAFRHGDPKTVEVEITYAAELRLRVRDDGKGIDAVFLNDNRPGHYGISGMRERAKRIGATLSVRSTAGAGTEIDLFVPGSRAFAIAFKSPVARGFGRREKSKHTAAGRVDT